MPSGPKRSGTATIPAAAASGELEGSFQTQNERKEEVVMLLGKLAKEAGRLLPHKKPDVSLQRKEEIARLKQQLQQFGIELSHLAGGSSGGDEARRLQEVSRTLAQQREFLHTLSLGDEAATEVWLNAHTGTISLKMWTQHRSYIVTMAHIFAGPYPGLRAYLQII
jgi:hypothetical protein